jgi:hypothetical protein
MEPAAKFIEAWKQAKKYALGARIILQPALT